MKKRLNIGILTFPLSKKGVIPLSNLIDILLPLSINLHLLTGNDAFTAFRNDSRLITYGLMLKSKDNNHKKIISYLYTQLIYLYRMIILSKKVDFWFFFIGAEGLIIPMIFLKLTKKKVILCIAGYPSKIHKIEKGDFFSIIEFTSNISMKLADKIIVYSYSTIIERNLSEYMNKIYIQPRHFQNYELFNVKVPYDKREVLLGYVGGLTEIKGVLNLMKSIQEILGYRNDIRFIIIGEGPLRCEIELFINKNKFDDKVRLLGWVEHDNLPDYLNKLKLIILPSYTEGFPNIILESMACGTPVVANNVGSISDIIVDNSNGFIMKNNSPECITLNILRAIESPDLEIISNNARAFVFSHFNYENIVNRYNSLLIHMMSEE